MAPYLFDICSVGGVMLASKTLVIRGSLDQAVCAVRGTRPPGRSGGRGDPARLRLQPER